LKDTCGGDKNLCCGIAMGGKLVDENDTPLGPTMDYVSICNLKPVDGENKA